MNLSRAVQAIVSKYGYDVFDNLHLIRDEDLTEAVETVYLARRTDEEIDKELKKLVKMCKSVDELSQKIKLSKRTTLKHLNFYTWGRDFIEKDFTRKQVGTHELYRMTQGERLPLLELSLKTKCSVSNLRRQLIKFDWGRSYLSRFCGTRTERRRRNVNTSMANH